MSDQLKRWLSMGLGRAHGAIRTPADRTLLLRACREDWRFDHQSEEERGWYLFHVIQSTGEPGFFHDELRRLLRHFPGTDEDDWPQIFSILRHFAQSDEATSRLLFQAFEEHGRSHYGFSWGMELVSLAGTDGLEFVLDLYLRWYRESELIPGRAWEICALCELAPSTSLTGRVRRLVELAHLPPAPHDQPLPLPSRYADLLQQWGSWRVFSRWGKTAPDGELLAAAHDLAREQDPERLHQLLRIFSRRAFPGPLDVLVRLVGHSHLRVAGTALTALEQLEGPELRELGLRWASTPALVCDAPRLLVRNGGVADYPLLAGCCDLLRDPDDWHSYTLAAQSFVHAHPGPSAAHLLMRLYEDGPCAFCRRFVVASLQNAGCLREQVRDECLHDAESSTRNMAAGQQAV